MMADEFEVAWPRFDIDGNGVRGGRLGAEVASCHDPRWDQMERIKAGDVAAVRRRLPVATRSRRGAGWDHYRLPPRRAI